MTTPPPPAGPSTNAIILAVTVMFISVIASITLMAVTVDDGARLDSLVGQILAALAPTVVAIVTLAQVRSMGRQVDFLANGGTDSKVRAAVADVVHPEFIRADADEQLARDRAVRDRQVPPPGV